MGHPCFRYKHKRASVFELLEEVLVDEERETCPGGALEPALGTGPRPALEPGIMHGPSPEMELSRSVLAWIPATVITDLGSARRRGGLATGGSAP